MASSAITSSPEGVKLAVSGFTSPTESQRSLDYYAEYFGQQLTLEHVRVTTQHQIAQALGLERQRQLLGCSDSSCVAEIAGALGVDGIVMGTLAKVGGQYQVDLRVISPNDARPIAAYSHRVEGEAELLDDYSAAARQVASALRARLKVSEPSGGNSTASLSTGQARRLSWVPAVAGVVLGGVGAYALVQATQHHDALISGTPIANPSAYGSEGATYQTLGWVFVSCGAAALASAAGLYVFGGPGQARVVAVPTGTGIGLAGAFP
jgi:hypothetical protein